MKVCPKCNAQLDSQVPVCPNCGYLFQQTNNQQQYAQSNVTPNYYQSQPQQSYAPYDHTAEFDPQDISWRKIIKVCVFSCSSGLED
jgi:predicted amidophosphoribosyltransferase